MTSPEVETVSRLVRESREGSIAAPAPNVRAHAIQALEAALQARARRKQMMRRAWVVLSAAALIALTVGGVMMRRAETSHANASTNDRPSPPTQTPAAATSEARGLALADGTMLAPGSRIVAENTEHAVLALASGTVLTARDGGDVTVVEASATERFMLLSGVVDARVAKLHGGERFIIATPDAEVEVRGTAFEVSIVEPDASCGDGSRTRLVVREGVVSVRSHDREVRVAAGERWPANCRTAATTHIAPVVATTAASPITTTATTTAATTPTPEVAAREEARRSTLAAQNDAFAHAMLLRQHGDAAGCAAELQTFIAQYPTSPLIESAHVERLRAVRVSDPARAAVLARQYLAQYPSGFARSEAEAIVGH